MGVASDVVVQAIIVSYLMQADGSWVLRSFDTQILARVSIKAAYEIRNETSSLCDLAMKDDA